jgi:hypothetical protein
MAHYDFVVEMRKYIPTGSSKDPKIEPGIFYSVMVIIITRF